MKNNFAYLLILISLFCIKVNAQTKEINTSISLLKGQTTEDSTLLKGSIYKYLDCYCLERFVNTELKYKRKKGTVNFSFYYFLSTSSFLGTNYKLFDSIANKYMLDNFQKYLEYYPYDNSSNYYSICTNSNDSLKEKYASVIIANLRNKHK